MANTTNERKVLAIKLFNLFLIPAEKYLLLAKLSIIMGHCKIMMWTLQWHVFTLSGSWLDVLLDPYGVSFNLSFFVGIIILEHQLINQILWFDGKLSAFIVSQDGGIAPCAHGLIFKQSLYNPCYALVTYLEFRKYKFLHVIW